jgi:serine racemase
MAEQNYCITFDNVKEAAARIKGVAHRTPVLTSQSLIPTGGKNYFFKVEAMQKTGSFKFRGALNAIKAELEESDPKRSSMPVVTHSSGNHAQALALAAKLACTDTTKVTATIVMPNNAPDVKKAAVADFGASIVMVENTNEAREGEADRIVERTGAVFIHPSEDPRVIAGQGTASLEFVEQVREMGKELDAVVIPVGGGGLAAGNAIALRGLLGDKVKVSRQQSYKFHRTVPSISESFSICS